MKTTIGLRMNLFTIVTIMVIFSAIMQNVTHARPSGLISRQKRVSDQRLAELETILGLAKLRGKLVTVPVGFGRVDPAKIGRRRRSSVQNRLEKLQRLLQSAAHDSESVSTEDSDEGLPSSWNDVEDRRAYELMD